MITLYTFGPHFGLPDPSPFVTKAEMLLKWRACPFAPTPPDSARRRRASCRISTTTASASRIPRSSAGTSRRSTASISIAGSAPSSAPSPGRSRRWRRIISTGRWWMRAGWMTPTFAKGPANFFSKVPALVRPAVIAFIRRQVRKSLHAHGMGRHSPAEIVRSRPAVDRCDRRLSRVQAVLHGQRADGRRCNHVCLRRGRALPAVRYAVRAAAERHDNLKRYVGRMTARYYPDFKEIAGCKAALTSRASTPRL